MKGKHAKSLAEWRLTTERRPNKNGRPPSYVEPMYISVGAVMTEMRERLGVTQHQLGVALGCTRANVANMESGKCRIMLHHVPVIAAQLRIPVTDLLPAEWFAPKPTPKRSRRGR